MTVLSPLQDCVATIEAMIFASNRPVRERELEVHLPNGVDVSEVIAIIAARYNETSGIELSQIADSWAFRTKSNIAERLRRHKKVERPLSRAALEVLAIIAYHQPITRSEIEEIRGISLSSGTMDILLELEWTKPQGRRRTPGRPLTWGTTIAFLDHFGLNDINDLPGMDELKSAGLLRKGQIIGALMDYYPQGDNLDNVDSDQRSDFLDDEFQNVDFNGDDDASV
ncbi:SMC-Scp complex subunit ScpB [Candidatus Puniceispirillum sp.]|nr:SMC-Scp complex subunit ScpB [Candidatus Puniceispirillum sp.]